MTPISLSMAFWGGVIVVLGVALYSVIWFKLVLLIAGCCVSGNYMKACLLSLGWLFFAFGIGFWCTWLVPILLLHFQTVMMGQEHLTDDHHSTSKPSPSRSLPSPVE